MRQGAKRHGEGSDARQIDGDQPSRVRQVKGKPPGTNERPSVSVCSASWVRATSATTPRWRPSCGTSTGSPSLGRDRCHLFLGPGDSLRRIRNRRRPDVLLRPPHDASVGAVGKCSPGCRAGCSMRFRISSMGPAARRRHRSRCRWFGGQPSTAALEHSVRTFLLLSVSGKLFGTKVVFVSVGASTRHVARRREQAMTLRPASRCITTGRPVLSDYDHHDSQDPSQS